METKREKTAVKTGYQTYNYHGKNLKFTQTQNMHAVLSSTNYLPKVVKYENKCYSCS